MHRVRLVRLTHPLLGLIVVCGPLLAGCGETSKPTAEVGESPAEKGKDSMEFYRAKMQPSKTAPKK